jgi:hypothetical protein
LRRGKGEADESADMLALLKSFWAAVAEVFPDAWNQPPRRSRLMHGAGVVAMGFIMDAITDRYRRRGVPSYDEFFENLKPLRGACRWTAGEWVFGRRMRRRWNDIQNTPKDIERLVDHLLGAYRTKVWNRTAALARTAAGE